MSGNSEEPGTSATAGPPAAPVGGAPAYSIDASRIPPKPTLPAAVAAAALDADESTGGVRRSAREDFSSHVASARDQFDQANERIKERTGRDLIVAIVIGVALGAVLLASLIFFKQLFVPIALAGGVLATWELARALRASGRKIDVVPQAVVAGMLILSGFFGPMWLSWVMLFVAVALVVVWRLVGQMVEQDERTYADVLSDVVSGGLVQVYIPFLTAIALILLRQPQGEWWVLSFIAIAVAADTAAYASGLAFGKHPMAPRVSPKKTWEGFAGALVAAVATAVLLGMFLLGIEWWIGAILGVTVLLSATLGDLGESMVKRDLGIKDMSSWVPGHGGLLDRLDSILPSTIPALCVYFFINSGLMA